MKISLKIFLPATIFAIAVFPFVVLNLLERLILRYGFSFLKEVNLTSFFLFINLIAGIYISSYVMRKTVKLFSYFDYGLSRLSQGERSFRYDLNKLDQYQEILRVLKSFNSLMDEIRDKNELLEKQSNLVAVGNLSAQVAHDIRSPLAALDSVLKDVSQLPEEKRIIIRSAVGRIRDIANNLIEKNRKSHAIVAGKSGNAAAAEPASIELLSSHIDPLITEKRLQVRSKIGIEIEARLDTGSYGLFAQVQPVEFKRALSNLINNAIEALGDKGSVKVVLDSKDDQILIRVQDNGKGIPPEILVKLGQRGETHGKAEGSGLGLYHARTSVESWGGTIEMASEIGKGTTVTVILPQAQPPEWFVSKLELTVGGAVVILDDDTSIHHIWQGRFDSIRVKEQGIEVFHFSTPWELRVWVKDNPAKAPSALYLTDYELIGHKETGLGLVEELGLGERAILITSRYEEKGILKECQRLKVRMIPKGLAGFVPIGFRHAPSPLSGPDAVLLDDDPLGRMLWEMKAKSNGINLITFGSPKAFLAAVGGFPKDTPIYFDCELADGVRGDAFAKDIYAKGFTNLFLATGHPPETFPPMSWIKRVVGKEPPWRDV